MTIPRLTRRRVLLATLAVLACYLYFQVIGFNPRIKIAKDTTYLTEPLAEDGLPAYGTWWMNRRKEGVTRKNNGAIPMLRAM